MKNKIIGFLLISVILFGINSYFDVSAQSVCLDEYEQQLLISIGITDEDVDLSKDITRAQMAHYVYLMENDLLIYSAEDFFEDVNEDTDYAAEINTLFVKGLVSGKASNIFAPEDFVTRQEAEILLVRYCGYDFLAMHEGYAKIANRIGISDGIKAEADSILKTDVFLRMCYNALNTKRFEATAYAENNVFYSNDSDETMLSIKFNVYEAAGTVEANMFSSTNPDLSSAEEGIVRINGQDYYIGNTKADEYLGAACNYYYYDDGSICKIMAIKLKDNVRMLNIKSDCIDYYSGNIFTYYNNDGRKKGAKISKAANMFYNGELNNDMDGTDLVPQNGEVILVDNENDGMYDTVFVYNYVDRYVSYIDKDNMYIVDDKLADSGYERIDLSEKSEYIIYKNGEKADFLDINVGEILSVFEGLSGKKLIYSSSRRLTGVLTEVKNDELICIEGCEFSSSKEYDWNKHLGKNSTFCFNAFDKIVYAEHTDVKHYGIITKTFTAGFDEFYVRVFTEEGVFETYRVKDKFILNGVRVKPSTDDTSMLWSNAGDARKLVLYELNDDGTLKSVTCALDSYDDKISDTLMLRYPARSDSSVIYQKVGKFFWDKANANDPVPINVDDNTKIFIIADDPDGDAEDYSIGTLNDFVSGAAVSADFYFINDSQLCKSIVIRDQDFIKKITDKNSVFLATAVYSVLINDDQMGLDIYGVDGVNLNGKLTVNLDDGNISESLTEINPGDYFMYKLNSHGNLVYIEKMFDGKEHKALITENENGNINTCRINYGLLEQYKDGVLTILRSDNTEMNYKYAGTVIKYDKTGKRESQIISAGQMVPGQEIIVRIADGDVRNVIIIE